LTDHAEEYYDFEQGGEFVRIPEYNESMAAELEVKPLADALVRKCQELNIPAVVVVCDSYTKDKYNMEFFCTQRKIQVGDEEGLTMPNILQTLVYGEDH
jgi:hypothetical protein